MTTRRLVLATRNPGKLTELRRILAAAECGGLGGVGGIELIGLADLPAYDDEPETGVTFADNALAKARAAVVHTGLAAVADDSGLCVDALNGMPGVLSARWSGRHGDDDANLDLVLRQVADVPDERRGAAFVCAAALVTPAGEQRVAQGRVAGTLLRGRRGFGGFGYDPIFVPVGETRTTAAMSVADKDALSHRGKALRALVSAVDELIR